VAGLEATGAWLFIGRLAEYAYFNMDQVIRRSLDKTAARLGERPGGAP
jgi:UDP-galactopyranose mutase